jgi:hypothetical protein
MKTKLTPIINLDILISVSNQHFPHFYVYGKLNKTLTKGYFMNIQAKIGREPQDHISVYHAK